MLGLLDTKAYTALENNATFVGWFISVLVYWWISVLVGDWDLGSFVVFVNQVLIEFYMTQISFTDLEVYKECRQLRIAISVLAKSQFPASENHKLTDQILRSSRSVTACIAEGYGRYYFKENIQFCRMSRGSLLETLDHLITAFDEKYISNEQLVEFKNRIDTCGKLLNGYINYLKKSAKPKEEG